jgi:hypothetical protein
VPPGATYWITNTVRVPVVDSAGWYLFFITDDGDSLFESTAANNTLMAPIRFELAAPCDLAPTDFVVPSVVTGSRDEPVTVAWRVANQGLGSAAGSWRDTVYLSSTPGGYWYDSTPLTSSRETHSLPPGSGYWLTNTVRLSGTPNGDYYLVLEANWSHEQFETAWDDNRLVAPIRVSFSLPDLPRIASGRFLDGGIFELAVLGQPGTTYVLQASTNLSNWVNATTFTCSAVPTYVRDLQAGNYPRRFYRIAPLSVIVPPGLTIASTPTNTLVISWPATGSDWRLEQSPTLAGSPPPWTQIPPPYQTNGTRSWVAITPAPGSRFYRLTPASY